MAASGKLIYGGTFNPVHIGHLRMAIEAWQRLRRVIYRVEFVPAYHQPLKNPKGILSFDLRVKMLEAALTQLPGFFCNTVESRRTGPSYTYDTLKSYPGTCSRNERFFLLGSQDYEKLPLWYKGLELPAVTNMVVVPRWDFCQEKFWKITEKFWEIKERISETCLDNANNSQTSCAMLNNNAKIYYVEVPKLEISSTQIRADWLAGQNIDWLVPSDIIEILNRNRMLIMAEWQDGNA